jgi:hypothetical protein
MHAVNPVQRLKLLQYRLENLSEAQLPVEMSAIQFHQELSAIFTSVRDFHTMYLLPSPFKDYVAFLPFRVEECHQGEQRLYVVSSVIPGLKHPTFTRGVEILRWNGVRIRRAVEMLAEQYGGSNRAAYFARGLERLTVRPLALSPVPDEDWVVVGYRRVGGDEREAKFPWRAFLIEDEAHIFADDQGTTPAWLSGPDLEDAGLDVEMARTQRAKIILFAPHVIEQVKAHTRRQGPLPARTPLAGQLFPSDMPTVFEARPVQTSNGSFGYIRIRTFQVKTVEGFVCEFMRLLELLPQDGLILDVRGNIGGSINCGECILQLLTPRRIEPEPMEFINTPVNRELCRKHATFTPWYASIKRAVETGAIYSQAFPITPPAQCNAIGQRYYGPKVLIVDALCYSATDIFSAGFQDHAIGPVLGVHARTGAGGANAFTQAWLAKAYAERVDATHGTPEAVASGSGIYEPLPAGADMRVALRRTLRVGKHAGTLLEDFGVIPDALHAMTLNDVLSQNIDLLEHVGRILAPLPRRRLTVDVGADAAEIALTVATVGISRLDVLVDGRPRQSLDVSDGKTSCTVPKSSQGQSVLEVQGYAQDELVAARRIVL